MAAAASDNFSGRLETDVTSIRINASRSISMTSTLPLELAGVPAAEPSSAAGACSRKLSPAKRPAHCLRIFLLFRRSVLLAVRLASLFITSFPSGPRHGGSVMTVDDGDIGPIWTLLETLPPGKVPAL